MPTPASHRSTRAVLPTTRVEYALRGDDALIEADVRELDAARTSPSVLAELEPTARPEAQHVTDVSGKSRQEHTRRNSVTARTDWGHPAVGAVRLGVAQDAGVQTHRLHCEEFWVDVRLLEGQRALDSLGRHGGWPDARTWDGRLRGLWQALAPFEGASETYWHPCPPTLADREAAAIPTYRDPCCPWGSELRSSRRLRGLREASAQSRKDTIHA